MPSPLTLPGPMTLICSKPATFGFYYTIVNEPAIF